MPIKTITFKAALLSLLLSGCANSLYFYETEKFSLTVEARPDSTQPVQGNLGIKQRVGLIVPGKEDNGNGGGEAMSSLSNFNLRIIDKGNIFNPVLIQTAFITGDAASGLYRENDSTLVEKASRAITVGVLSARQLSSVDKIIGKLFSSDNKLDNKKFEDFLSCAGFKPEEVQNYVKKYKDKSLVDFKTAFREDFSWEASSYFEKCRKSLGE